MEKITLTQEMHQEARRVEKEVMAQKFIVKNGNYTGLESEGRFYLGRLAERAFYELTARMHEIVWVRKDNYLLPDDGYDFTIGGQKVDIKMIPHYGKYFLVNVKEVEHNSRLGKTADIYVGVVVNLDRSEAWVACWFPKVDVLEFERSFEKPAYAKLISEVTAPYNDIAALMW